MHPFAISGIKLAQKDVFVKQHDPLVTFISTRVAAGYQHSYFFQQLSDLSGSHHDSQGHTSVSHRIPWQHSLNNLLQKIKNKKRGQNENILKDNGKEHDLDLLTFE